MKIRSRVKVRSLGARHVQDHTEATWYATYHEAGEGRDPAEEEETMVPLDEEIKEGWVEGEAEALGQEQSPRTNATG